MPAKSWLDQHLVAVLRRGVPVLARWRDQRPGLQGHVKNFENWVLVELNNELHNSGYARAVLTNGFFADDKDELSVKRVKAADVLGLAGRTKAVYLSVDLSVRLPSGETQVAEIKTGLAGLDLLDDVRRVQYYQGTVATRAEVAWVVALPGAERRLKSARKSFDRIVRRLKEEPSVAVETTPITEWLLSTVIVPTGKLPPNLRLQPTAAEPTPSRRG